MKKIGFVLLLCMGFIYASAQEVYTSSGRPGYHKKTRREKGYDPSKLVIGGGLSAGYSSGFAVAGISPIVGYKFFKNFTAGVGLGYLYTQQPVDIGYSTYYYRQNIIYPSIWAKYTVYRGLYVTSAVEQDIISGTYPDNDPNNPNNIIRQKYNTSLTCLLAGVGLRQPLGGRVSFFVEAMHEFLQNNNVFSPYYDQPLIFHAGIAAGL